MEPLEASIAPPACATKFRDKRRPLRDALSTNEIHEFLAHSDADGSDSSDWDDVKEETEVGEESSSKPQMSPVPSSSSRQFPVDVGVAELFGTARTALELDISQTTNVEQENILDFSDLHPTELNEYGAKILRSLKNSAADKHEKCVEKKVTRIIQASEQSPADPHQEVLKACEERRQKFLATKAVKPSAVGEYFTATPTNIRIMRSQISSELWETRTTNRRVFGLAQYLQEVKVNFKISSTETTVLVGVVGSKVPPRKSRNNKIYSIWRLTDLTSVGTGSSYASNVSLFLFGTTHEKLWKEPEGTVVAILKPKVLPLSENDHGHGSSNDLSITVDSAPFVMLLGFSPDFAHCAGTTKAGKPCTMIVNKNACRYCDFHIKSAYISASSTRPGFATKALSRSGMSRGGSFGGPSHFSQPAGVYSLQRPDFMPANPSQDAPISSYKPTRTSRLSLNMEKLTSAGFTVKPTSSVLPSSPGVATQVLGLSNSEAAFVSALRRPSRGSLNLLLHIESKSIVCTNKMAAASNSSSQRDRRSETFATFFAGLPSQKSAPPRHSEEFVDLGPAAPLTNSTTLLRTTPVEAARTRAEALVRARGSVKALEASSLQHTRKRISEVVAQATAKRQKASPLEEMRGAKAGSSGAVLADAEGSRNQATRQRRREELVQLVGRGSRHADLAETAELDADRRRLLRLEARDAVEQKLVNQHEQECQVVTCLKCQYRSVMAGKICLKEGHKLQFSTGVRRFFACRNCKARTTTLDRYPNLPCKKCGETVYDKTGAIAERKGPKLAGEQLQVRGLEEKYLS